MQDPYSVLGLSAGASEADIKKAYRRLAKENHPDRRAGDTAAKDRFAQISQAYEILGDKERRGRFDRGEIDAEGRPRHPGFGAADFTTESIDPSFFADLFGGFGRGSRAGRSEGFQFDAGQAGGFSSMGGSHAEEIFRSVFSGRGGRKTGGAAGFAGHAADNRTSEPAREARATLAVTLEQVVSGEKLRVTLPSGKTIAVRLPMDLSDGQVVRLKGQGSSSAPGRTGDALVTIRIVPHPTFKPAGIDLKTDVAIPLETAVLGGKVTVPTLEGKIRLSVPPYSSSGQVLRIRGKGLPGRNGRGDILATLQIALPSDPDPALEALMHQRRRPD